MSVGLFRMMGNTFEQVLASEGVLCYTNVGVSMMPLLREGKDIMVIRPVTGDIRRFDAVLFRRPGVTGRGAYVVHRVLEVLPEGRYWIVGDNCTEGEVVLRENILGILTDVRRGGKGSVLEEKWYPRYLKYWVQPYRLRFAMLKLRRFLIRCRKFPRRCGSFVLRRVLKIPKKR